MKRALKISTLVFLIVFSLLNCSTHLVPKPKNIKKGEIPDFYANNSIKIINNQPSKKDIALYSADVFNNFYGNLNTWTDVAGELLGDELKKRGVSLDENSSNALKIAITHVNVKTPLIDLICEIDFTVETSDGYKADYFVENRAKTLYRATNGVIPLMVIKILNDRAILSFISRNNK